MDISVKHKTNQTIKGKMEASVARCLPTPLIPATEQDLIWSVRTA